MPLTLTLSPWNDGEREASAYMLDSIPESLAQRFVSPSPRISQGEGKSEGHRGRPA